MRMCGFGTLKVPSQREKVRIYPPIEEDMLWKFIGIAPNYIFSGIKGVCFNIFTV